jgi:hypothetical protein
MELKLEVEINPQRQDELDKLNTLIREGWGIARIDPKTWGAERPVSYLITLLR